jgi:hypothetical protein
MIRIRRPRYADVAATLALVVALGGTTAYAAQQLHVPKHAVGKSQLKRDSVTSAKIKNGKVKAQDLHPGAVGPGQLADGGVTNAKLAGGSVGTAKLQDGSVTGAKVANRSITLDDLVGADVVTSVSWSIAAGDCQSVPVTVPGARAGQAGFVTFTGALPMGDVAVGPLRVSGSGASFSACNLGQLAADATNLPVRVVTLG